MVYENQNNFGAELTLLFSEVFLLRHRRRVRMGLIKVPGIGQSLQFMLTRWNMSSIPGSGKRFFFSYRLDLFRLWDPNRHTSIGYQGALFQRTISPEH